MEGHVYKIIKRYIVNVQVVTTNGIDLNHLKIE